MRHLQPFFYIFKAHPLLENMDYIQDAMWLGHVKLET